MANYSNFTGVKYDNFKSFLIALFIYALAVLVLLYQMMDLKNKPKKFTDDKDALFDTISIDIDDTPIPTAPNIAKEDKEGDSQEKKEKPVEEEKIKTTAQAVPPPTTQTKPKEPEKPKEEPNSEPKKEEEPKEKPELKINDVPAEKKIELEPKKEDTQKDKPKKKDKHSLNDLFSDTTSDNKILEDSTKKDNAIQSSKKSDKETARTSTKEQATSKNALVKSNVVTGRTKLTGEFDAYRGKINKILQKLWSRYNTTINDDSTVLITFGADGRISDYEIKKLGLNTEFNQKLRDFLSNLQNQSFPKSPDGKPFIYEVNLNDVIRSGF